MDRAERLLPPGFDARRELNIALGILACAAGVLVLGFLLAYLSGHGQMYEYSHNQIRSERPGAVFPSFESMMVFGRAAFILAHAAYIWLLFRYVSYHYSGGSRAAYTMRRLKNRWEFPVRCLAFPLAGTLLAQLCMRLLTLGCGWIYMSCTLERWLPEDGWARVIHLVTH